jgi:hypothetical protein
VEKYKIPTPLPKPRELGKDSLGKDLGSYTPKEYRLWKEGEDKKEIKLRGLRAESRGFRQRYLSERKGKEESKVTDQEIEEERQRRREIGQLRGEGTFYWSRIC